MSNLKHRSRISIDHGRRQKVGTRLRTLRFTLFRARGGIDPPQLCLAVCVNSGTHIHTDCLCALTKNWFSIGSLRVVEMRPQCELINKLRLARNIIIELRALFELRALILNILTYLDTM